MTSASELTEWIALYVPDGQSDGQGGLVDVAPANLDPDVPAKVEQQSANVSTGTGQTGADRVRYKITVRYEPGITRDYRVLWNDMHLSIDTIDPVSQWPDYMVMVCLRREAGAQ